MDNINTPNQVPPTPSAPQAPVSGNTTPNPLMNQNFGGGGEQKSSLGPIIGSVIVVLMIVAGGLYLYGKQLGEKTIDEVTPEEISAAIDQATVSFQTQGSTDSVDEISADLDATDLNNLAAELESIDKELSL